jgi:hypothetical protein
VEINFLATISFPYLVFGGRRLAHERPFRVEINFQATISNPGIVLEGWRLSGGEIPKW